MGLLWQIILKAGLKSRVTRAVADSVRPRRGRASLRTTQYPPHERLRRRTRIRAAGSADICTKPTAACALKTASIESASEDQDMGQAAGCLFGTEHPLPSQA
jgi:hypothetical protein